MGIADEFERRLEQVVDGFFSKAFRSKIQPAEIGKRLLREMEGGKTVSVGTVYVPNSFRVTISTAEFAEMSGLTPALQRDFASLLEEAASERKWRFPGKVIVEFAGDDAVKTGRLKVEAQHDSSAKAPDPPPAEIQLSGSDQRWQLARGALVMGRAENSDIVVPDRGASRRHAELRRREDGWWLADLGSTNGTLVNGVLVKERRLHPGDLIRIGEAEFNYLEQQETEPSDNA